MARQKSSETNLAHRPEFTKLLAEYGKEHRL